MITYWQQIGGKFVNTEKESLDSDARTWVDARNVTREDITVLEKEFKIDQEHIIDILDPDELSRIEDADGYILTIIRLPIFSSSAEVSYFSIPLGVILQKNFIITICWTDCEVLKDFSANRVKNINISDFPAFLIRILSRADITYLRYLKEINRRALGIQDELQYSVENKEILQLLNLEKSTVFFTTSIKSNQLLLEKLRKTKLLKFDEDDLEWLDDVEIDNRQALEMADTYSQTFSRMSESFGSIISNNMNGIMKTLTVFTVVVSMPTFITSYFGMNVDLPLTIYGKIGCAIISAMCVASAAAVWLLVSRRRPRTKDREKRKKNRARRSEVRRLKKAIEAQELNLEKMG